MENQLVTNMNNEMEHWLTQGLFGVQEDFHNLGCLWLIGVLTIFPKPADGPNMVEGQGVF